VSRAPCVGPDPAPLRRRIPAFLVDQLVVFVAVVGPLAAVGVRGFFVAGDIRTAVFVALMLVAFAYHFTLEWLTAETVGKRLFGLRVVADDGEPLNAWRSFVRNALRLVDGLGYWSVAVLVICYRGDGKRLGDVFGRSLVVRRESAT